MICWTWTLKALRLTYWNQSDLIITRLESKFSGIIIKTVSKTIKFSKFDSPKSDYVWCVKKRKLMLFVAKLGIFRIKQELPKSNSNLISFKK